MEVIRRVYIGGEAGGVPYGLTSTGTGGHLRPYRGVGRAGNRTRVSLPPGRSRASITPSPGRWLA
jgi:hypothetical protein